MAFHLHRLNLTGTPLREAMNGKAAIATALSQGRMTIENGFIADLAATLNIATEELTRELKDDEQQSWGFYRTSAANKDEVWSNVAAFAATNNISLRSLAHIVGLKEADISNSISGKRQKVFTLTHALKLSASSTPPSDPSTFLPAGTGLER